MTTIDIRKLKDDTITDIIVSDYIRLTDIANRTGIELEQLQVGDEVTITLEDGEIDNLIKALKKVQELRKGLDNG